MLLSPPDAFPQNLKKLIFSGHLFIPWKDFSIVGKLPKLESVIISYTFFIDVEWEVSGEGFPYLKIVLLEYLNIRYRRPSRITFHDYFSGKNLCTYGQQKDFWKVEEVAEKCLKDLMDRSLISIYHLSFDGKIESCGMHDLNSV